MNKSYQILLLGIVILALDQGSKYLFLQGFTWSCPYFSLHLVFNEGVAFSMLSSLGSSLKYAQLALLLALSLFFLRQKSMHAYKIELCVLLISGASNILDRFIHGAVIDFFAWHWGFRFAVFNLADTFINLAVFSIILKEFISWLRKKNQKKETHA